METLQEMFTKSVQAVVKQGRPAMVDGACQYLAPNGDRCAIGHLMTDEELTRWKDSTLNLDGLARLADDTGEDFPERFRNHLSPLSDLQRAHDEGWCSNFVRLFLLDAEKVAKKYKLEMPEVEND